VTLATFSRVFVAALAGAMSGTSLQAEEGLTDIGMKGNDGIYAVHAMTKQGSCDRDNYWTILVSGGRISSPSGEFADASGHITSRGAVNVQFERFGQVAMATGKVIKGTGMGTWISPTLNCSGSWRATRRG
jgi:hypothetical protein